MTFNEVMTKVTESRLDDWQKLEIPTVYKWDYGTDRGKEFLHPCTMEYLAVFKPDVDISLSFFQTIDEMFRPSWVESFPKEHASLESVWIRYRGAVINTWTGVLVDEKRYLVPIPVKNNESFEVSQSEMPLARLMFGLFGSYGVHDNLEHVLQRAGIAMVE